MMGHDLILTLAKVLVAAAWADGELAPDEINSMKEVLSRLPHLTARDWASVDIYMASPVGEMERSRLVEELRQQVATPDNKQVVFAALDDLAIADGVVSEQERQAIAQIKVAIGSGTTAGLSRLFRGLAGAPKPAQGPNREIYLDDFVSNRVYFVMQRRMERGEGTLNLPDAALRKLSLAGGMLARVAGANPEITDSERAVMIEALRAHWPLAPAEAGFVVDVAVAQLPAGMDNFRLADEFAQVSEYEERGQMVDALFAVAAADGAVTDAEVADIRTIAGALSLPHQRFIEAKLRVGGSGV
jgi:uncharacterized tellurite resistance protein B-like protein